MNAVKSDNSLPKAQINSVCFWLLLCMFKLHAIMYIFREILLTFIWTNTVCFICLDLLRSEMLFYYCAVAMLEIDVKEMQMYISCWFLTNLICEY